MNVFRERLRGKGFRFGIEWLGVALMAVTMDVAWAAKPTTATAPPAQADASVKPSLDQRHGDWRMLCVPPQSSCRLEQRIFLEAAAEKDAARPLLQVLIVPNETPEPKLVLLLVTPLGIQLPPGVGFQIDQTDERILAVQRCLPQGCQVLVGIDAALRRALEQGHEAVVRVQLPDGRRLGIPVSLKGLTQGLKALEKY